MSCASITTSALGGSQLTDSKVIDPPVAPGAVESRSVSVSAS
ncbi:MAG: hypothetical protein U0R24_00175 [Solirubrobacterales bacterium]